ncbi:MAG TPA: glycosyltransferase [Chthoniobacteraceae bacterium]|nr:glycosyltransferase [Chthoniobacteraceae bacterium]
MRNFVVGVVATWRRPTELARLLDSLKNAGPDFGGIVISDNAGDPAIDALFESTGLRGLSLPQSENLGCGGGLRAAEQTACSLFKKDMTHLWILDDDVEVLPDTLPKLLHAMERENADAAHPMATNAEGRLGWFPGLLDSAKFRAVRDAATPADYLAKCGPDPVPFSWSTGVALLVTRRAIEEAGFHRDNYWVRGEDLEFSLRITHGHKGIFVPTAEVKHFAVLAEKSGEEAYLKHCAMLQNLCYTGLHLAHGRRIARTIPGNFLRFLKSWPPMRAIPDAALAFLLGGLRAKPAGVAQIFRNRLLKTTSRIDTESQA